MVNWKTIKDLRDLFIDSYINTKLSKGLEKACSEEYELKRDYNGRQILELLQNVDDVYNEMKKSDKDNIGSAFVKITYKNNILEVGNTGVPFSADSIEGLCIGRASSKSSDNIGNKGTGFRSLLNDAEWIEIHSGNYHIRFSEEYTKSLFNQYKNYSPIKEQIENWKKEDYDLCFPIMNCPEEIDSINSSFDTVIRVKVKAKNIEKDTSILKQLSLPFYKALLFLPNITRIEVETDLEKKIYEKKIKNNIASLHESNELLCDYFVQSKEVILSNGKTASLIIAVPLDKNYDFSKEKLYCYFPIRSCNTPVHALIHAPFQTNNSRDDIPNDENQINKELLMKCLEFLKEVAEQIASQGIGDIDLPILTLTPTDNFYGKIWTNDSFNLKDFYINLISNAKLLPTVNGELISIEDKPKYISMDFPHEFMGDKFRNLLIRLKEDTFQFIKILAQNCGYSYWNLLYEYHLDDLKNNINTITDSFNIKTSVSIFLWWSKWWRVCRGKHYYQDIVPNLLKDTRSKWVETGKRIYLPNDTATSYLHDSLDWVDLCILNKEYVAELIKQIKNIDRDGWQKIKRPLDEKSADKRILDKYSDEYFPVKFKEQSESDLVIKDINEQIDTPEKSINFLNWFFENYKEKFKEDSKLYNVDYNFVDRNNKVVSSKKLYFGIEYGKPLSESIFKNTSCLAIAPLSIIFKGNVEDREDFIEFLKKCGVSVFPKIYDAENLAVIDYGFTEFVKRKYKFDKNINYLYKIKKIDNFQSILKNLTTSDIVQWFNQDEKFKNLMMSNEKGYFSNRFNSEQYMIDSCEYVRYILNNTEWIELGDIKYSPKQIVKYSKLDNKIKDLYGISENALIDLLGKNIVSEFKLDFVSSMAMLPDETIYKILLELPDVDSGMNKGEISRKLYDDIITFKKESMPSYEKNLQNIKVRCLDGEFRLNKDVKYASRKLERNINDRSCLIDIQPKRNSDVIKKWFGVEKFKMTLELENYDSLMPSEKDFVDEVSDLKITVLASLGETDNFTKKIKRLEIIPCSQIKTIDVENNNKIVMIEDYNYFKLSESKYLIKLPEDYDRLSMQQSLEFGDSIVEIFEDAVSPQINKDSLGYLISVSSENKKIIIANKFGIDKWDYVKEILYKQKDSNESIINYFINNALPSENLVKIQNIDFSRKLSQNEFNDLKEACFLIEKDISDIDSHDNIDVRENIIKEFDCYKELQTDNFKKAYYLFARQNPDKQENYLEICNNFRCYELKNVKNSVYEKVETLFNDMIKNEFDDVDIKSDYAINPNDTYETNYNYCLQKFNIKREEFDFIIRQNQKLRSSLYFDISTELGILCEEFVKKEDNEQVGIIDDNERQTSIVERELKKRKTIFSNVHRVKSEQSQEGYKRRNETNEKIGELAENIAYNELKKEKNYPNIIWHSKYSKKPADKNNAPKDVVCDMWNVDENGNKTYFEVKSSINEFEMSLAEYNSMKNFPNEYKVVLVDVKNNTISLHNFEELDGLKQVGGYIFKFD